jgi:hypothetical protein
MIDSTARGRRSVMAICLGAALLIVAASLLGRQFERGSVPRIAIALLQGAATAVAVIVPVRSIRGLDEMHQRIQLEALAFAFAGTGTLTTAYGFLVSAGLPDKAWTWALVWPLMAMLWAIGLVVASRRYR